MRPRIACAGGQRRGGQCVASPTLLFEDNSIRSRATALFNGRVGYNFENGISVSLDILNLTNAKADQITYAYVSRLRGDLGGAVGGVVVVDVDAHRGDGRQEVGDDLPDRTLLVVARDDRCDIELGEIHLVPIRTSAE